MTSEKLRQWIGPRPPADVLAQNRLQFLLPTVFLGMAAFCLLVSVFVPHWRLKLLAPQYPKGLEVQVYVNHMTGDVEEIDRLNHYIGMRPLAEAAQLERSLSTVVIVVLSLLVIAAIYIHNQYAALLSLPAMLFPVFFLGDLYYWLRTFGTHLDPKAPLSQAIKPFVPPIWGEGRVGQFRTVAAVDSGFYLACLAALLILVGLYFHRRAYKPLVDAMAESGNEGASG